MSARDGLREALEYLVKELSAYAAKNGLGPARLMHALVKAEAALAADAPEPCDGCEEQVPTVLVGEGPVNLCGVCIGKLLESWKKVADAPEQAVCKNCGRPLSKHRGDGRCPVLPTGA